MVFKSILQQCSYSQPADGMRQYFLLLAIVSAFSAAGAAKTCTTRGPKNYSVADLAEDTSQKVILFNFYGFQVC